MVIFAMFILGNILGINFIVQAALFCLGSS